MELISGEKIKLLEGLGWPPYLLKYKPEAVFGLPTLHDCAYNALPHKILEEIRSYRNKIGDSLTVTTVCHELPENYSVQFQKT